jgi:hypothetical protein
MVSVLSSLSSPTYEWLSYIWNVADKAADYVKLTFGVFFSELAQNFKAFLSGSESYKLRFYVGHDGTMIRLAAGLGIGKASTLRWPGLGSEIVMEVSGWTMGSSSICGAKFVSPRSGEHMTTGTLCA